MKPMSEVLIELGERLKRVEGSIAETADRSQATLQARRQDLEDELDRRKNELDSAATQVQDASRSWWSDAKGSIERQVASMRTDFEKWQGELRGKNAERAAKNAEDNAAATMEMANYYLNAAEWAAVQAQLARADADDVTEKR